MMSYIKLLEENHSKDNTLRAIYEKYGDHSINAENYGNTHINLLCTQRFLFERFRIIDENIEFYFVTFRWFNPQV